MTNVEWQYVCLIYKMKQMNNERSIYYANIRIQAKHTWNESLM